MQFSQNRLPRGEKIGCKYCYLFLFFYYGLMRPGNGETIIILDRTSEIYAIEAGMAVARDEDGQPLNPAAFEGLFTTEDYIDFPAVPMAGGSDLYNAHGTGNVRHDVPAFEVSREHVQTVKAAAEACLTINGLKGTLLKLTGAKRAAQKIVSELSDSSEL
jgi:hypothetical protein